MQTRTSRRREYGPCQLQSSMADSALRRTGLDELDIFRFSDRVNMQMIHLQRSFLILLLSLFETCIFRKTKIKENEVIMRITGYLTAHGVLDLVSTLFTFYRRSSFVFLYPSSGFRFSPSVPHILCFITWLASVRPGLVLFSLVLFVLIPPKACYRWSASQLVFGISCLSSVLSFAIYISWHLLPCSNIP